MRAGDPSEEVFQVAGDSQHLADRAFDRWSKEIRALLGPEMIIEHIGATAVPGALSKGDLDILVVAPRAQFRWAEAALVARFPRNEGNPPTETYASFRGDGTESPPLGVQLASEGSDDAVMFLRFRDRLRASAALLAAYNALKREWDGKPMSAYRNAKERFILAALDQKGA